MHEAMDDELGPHWGGRFLVHHTESADSLREILDNKSLESVSGAGVSFSVHPYWGHALKQHKHVSGPTVVFHRHAIQKLTTLETPKYLTHGGERRADNLSAHLGDIDVTHDPNEAGEKINRKYGPWEGELTSWDDPIHFQRSDVSHVLYHHNTYAHSKAGITPQKVREQMQDLDMMKSADHAARHGIPFFVATAHKQNAKRLSEKFPDFGLHGNIIRTSSTEWRKSDLARHYKARYQAGVDELLAGGALRPILEGLLGLQRVRTGEKGKYLLDPRDTDYEREMYNFKDNFPRWGTEHQFSIIHPKHGRIGDLHVTHGNRTKRLFVPWIQVEHPHEHEFSMKSVATSLAGHFPKAQEISGLRITGRRPGIRRYRVGGAPQSADVRREHRRKGIFDITPRTRQLPLWK